MEASGSRGPPKKPSFETGTRVAVHSIVCHVCFFCGNTFPVLSDYQRHIVHEHQMASIAYQLYSEEHPLGKEGSLKRVKSEDKKKENGDEKRQKMDPSLNTSIQSQPSLLTDPLPPTSIPPTPISPTHIPPTSIPPSPSRPPPINTHPSTTPDRPYQFFPVALEAQEKMRLEESPRSQSSRTPLSQYLSPEASPSQPPKNLIANSRSPILPPGRYPANKQMQLKRSSLSTPMKLASESPKDGPGEVCAVCRERFSNGTSLIVHCIKDHATIIREVEHFIEQGGKIVQMDRELTSFCTECKKDTPTLTQSFEHYILAHKGHIFRGTEATVATFALKCSAPGFLREFSVNIRLKRQRT